MERLLIGTRFEDDEIKQKQNFYNQKAVNEKGHKRFHGAFTGGFSAGYKGTVGSEEGFVPKTFTSSRQNRANTNNAPAQSIQDYMDEEDLGTHVIGANLTTKSEYDTFENVSENIQSKKYGDNFFGKIPSELIVEQRKTVGWEILNNIQFKKKKKESVVNSIKGKFNTSQGGIFVGNNVIDFQDEGEEVNIEDDDDDDDDADNFENRGNTYFDNNRPKYDTMENYKIKTNYNGIGFKAGSTIGMDDIDEFAEEEFNRLMKRSIMTQEEIEEEQAKKKENNRIYTNFKTNYNYDEDDDDEVFVDQTQKEIEYQSHEVTKSDSKKMIQSSYLKMKGLNLLFIKDSKALQIESRENKIVVPENYNPYKKMQEYIKSGGKMIEFQKQKKKLQKMNAVQRQTILEGQQEMDRIKEQIQTKRFVKAQDDEEQESKESKNSVFNSWNPEKQQRYKQWVQEKEGNGIFISVASVMSYKEMKAEQKEFSKVYNELHDKTDPEKQQTKTVIDKIDDLQKKIDEIKNFRTCEPFFPDKLLCKRFGVLPPYKDKEYFDKKMSEFRQLQEKDNFLQTKTFVKGSSSSSAATAASGNQIDPTSLGLPTEFKSNKYGLISYKKDENDMDYDDDENDDGQEANSNRKFKKRNSGLAEDSVYDVGLAYKEQKQQRQLQISENLKIIEEIESEKQEHLKEKPPIQLFKSIFGDDSDEDEDDKDIQK